MALLDELPEQAATQAALAGHQWEITHELLAQLIEEVSLMNTDPRRVRKEPLSITRPGDTSSSEPQVETGLHETATGGTRAVGLEGMIALSMSMGHTRPPAPTPTAGEES